MPRKSRTSKKHTMRRKHRGGYYGAVGAIAPGAMEWGRGSEMGDWAISSRGANAMYGRGRKGSKKNKAKKTRKMRGGNKFGAVSASYQGTGARGIADFVQTNTKYPPFGPAQLGAFNNAGAQPGSGHANFVKPN
jgi:hypothetical protein